MPGRVMIIESHSGGHRLYYVRLLIDAAARLRIPVTVSLGPGVAESTEFQLHLANVQEHFELDYHNKPLRISEAVRMAHATGCRLIVVPDGDLHLSSLALRRHSKIDINVLLMRDPRQEPAHSFTRWLRLTAKSSVVRVVARRRDTTVLTLRGPGYRGELQESYVNDPIDPCTSTQATEAISAANLSADIFWFGLVGVLSARKHPDLVIEALRAIGRKDVGLFIAGPISESAARAVRHGVARLEEAGISVVILDRHLTNAEMNAAIAAMDCVVVAYDTHAPPSTLGKSFALGTRCVIAGSQQLQRHAEELGHGLVGPLNSASLSNLMVRALSMPAPPPRDVPVDDRFAEPLLGIIGRNCESAG